MTPEDNKRIAEYFGIVTTLPYRLRGDREESTDIDFAADPVAADGLKNAMRDRGLMIQEQDVEISGVWMVAIVIRLKNPMRTTVCDSHPHPDWKPALAEAALAYVKEVTK